MEASEEERIGEMQAKGSIPFDNVENSQLADHLVPLSQRREQDIIQEGSHYSFDSLNVFLSCVDWTRRLDIYFYFSHELWLT